MIPKKTYKILRKILHFITVHTHMGQHSTSRLSKALKLLQQMRLKYLEVLFSSLTTQLSLNGYKPQQQTSIVFSHPSVFSTGTQYIHAVVPLLFETTLTQNFMTCPRFQPMQKQNMLHVFITKYFNILCFGGKIKWKTRAQNHKISYIHVLPRQISVDA